MVFFGGVLLFFSFLQNKFRDLFSSIFWFILIEEVSAYIGGSGGSISLSIYVRNRVEGQAVGWGGSGGSGRFLIRVCRWIAKRSLFLLFALVRIVFRVIYSDEEYSVGRTVASKVADGGVSRRSRHRCRKPAWIGESTGMKKVNNGEDHLVARCFYF